MPGPSSRTRRGRELGPASVPLFLPPFQGSTLFHPYLGFRRSGSTLLMFAKYSVGAQRAAPALARHLLCPKTTLYSAGINRLNSGAASRLLSHSWSKADASSETLGQRHAAHAPQFKVRVKVSDSFVAHALLRAASRLFSTLGAVLLPQCRQLTDSDRHQMSERQAQISRHQP